MIWIYALATLFTYYEYTHRYINVSVANKGIIRGEGGGTKGGCRHDWEAWFVINIIMGAKQKFIIRLIYLLENKSTNI